MLGVPLGVVSTAVVGGVAPPSFSQVMLGGGTPLALQDRVTSFHSRETADEGSERMNEFATRKGIETILSTVMTALLQFALVLFSDHA